MSARPFPWSYPTAHSSPATGSRHVSAPHTPRENGLLAALPRMDYERLLPHLQPVALPQGLVLHRAGEQESRVCFLAAGLVSRVFVTRDGASAEFAITGREGVIGLASFLGGGRTPSQAVVLRAGYGYWLASALLEEDLERNGPLARLMLRYTHALIAQAGQIAACNRHHSLEQRLCRWILSCLDRVQSDNMAMTQDLIARLLGVQRQGVTHAAGRLKSAGLIRYSRGRIAVLDRARLEAQACECYAVVKGEYERLLNERGRPRGSTSALPDGSV